MRFARILCCAALAVCAFGVRAQQVMLDKVVAVVGGSSITYSEVENTARRLTESRREQGYTSDRDPMNEALEQLMMQKLLYNQALIDSVEIMKTDIMARVEEEVQDMIAREGTIPAVEAKMHNPIFNIRENLRRRYEEEAYASGMQREVIGKVTIIPGEVERFYRQTDKDSLPVIGDQYVYAHITKFPKSIDEAKRRARERLLEMRERIITGDAKFDLLARIYSVDGSALHGGEMEPCDVADLRAALRRRAFGVETGTDIGGRGDAVRLPPHPAHRQEGQPLSLPSYPDPPDLHHRRALRARPSARQHRGVDPRRFADVRGGGPALFGRSLFAPERRYRDQPRVAGALQR